MEHINLTFSATRQMAGKALAGVVSSGDLEVLFTAGKGPVLEVAITTSINNSRARWEALFARLAQSGSLPAGKMLIHDAGATPGVARIRIEQVFEEVNHA